jgi:transcriptional regulator with XRE-family HTH domain
LAHVNYPGALVKRVAQRVAAIRRAQGVTQEQLAERLGTAPRNIQRIEAGQNLTLRTLERVAEALGVDPIDLLRE